jgi:hypothetical protein
VQPGGNVSPCKFENKEKEGLSMKRVMLVALTFALLKDWRIKGVPQSSELQRQLNNTITLYKGENHVTIHE